MRVRWQLSLGGGLVALAALLCANAYIDEPASGEALTDPVLVVLVVGLGAGIGALMGGFVARPLRELIEEVRDARERPDDDPHPPRGRAATELLDLHRALRDLRSCHRQTVSLLRSGNSRLEATLDSITEGVLVTDGDGRILMANRALRSLFGFTRPADGRLPVEVVRNETVGDAVDDALAGKGPVSCEITIGAGSVRHLDVHVAPISGPEGVGGTVSVFYEITRLRHLERMRADFVANVSHELRTPLTAIKGCAETLVDGALEDAGAARRFVGVIANHADRLTTLLNDLLDLARLESDKTALEPAGVHARRLVDSARDAVSKTAADRGISIEVEVPPDLVVWCDRKLIEQALINLVDNAVKYTPEDGSVRVSARALSREQAIVDLAHRTWSAGGVEDVSDADEGDHGRADAVLVEVTDNGIGIASDEVGRVFERFYRVDRGRSRALGGTGLGLSIVRHAVELHGERVFVDTELGRGSTFGFTLAAC